MAKGIYTNLIEGTSKPMNVEVDNEDHVSIKFSAEQGLYQFSVISDAKEFNWEELYIDLYKFNNKGQRTGPWDFHVTEGNRALLPSYWVKLDNKELGLWYFERVSIEDLNNKRFRGKIAFYIADGGQHTLEITPYREIKIQWLSAVLEKDPEDVLNPLECIPANWFNKCPAAKWRNREYWSQMKEKLNSSHKIYQTAINRSFAWSDKEENHKPENLPLIIAKYYLNNDENALKVALDIINNTIKKEAWGNQRADGYGHNGDMDTMYTLWSLSLAYHYLYDLMPDELRVKLINKLELQGQLFFEKVLLYRDYWGGSLVQDHGWKSMFGFGCAAIHLLGIVPQAEVWVSYIIPRLERSLKAMPEDGFIPASSHYSTHLYLEYTYQYRDALLALTGNDIFKTDKFYKIVDYLTSVVREKEVTLMCWGTENLPFVGGNGFLNAIASIHNDGRAAYLQELLLKVPEQDLYHFTRKHAYYNSMLWGFLNYDPDISPVKQLERPCPLYFYEDSGVAHYRDDQDDITLSVKVGPPSGYNSYRSSINSCDRLGISPGAGHFNMSVGGTPLLMTPDAGYRLITEIRSCMLVNGKGQKDNIGYTMSIPSYKYEGEEIQFAKWDDKNNCGIIKTNLAPAYSQQSKIAHYTREFVIQKGKNIVCREHVVLDEPQQLSWLFQTRNDRDARIQDGIAIIGTNPSIKITPKVEGVKLLSSIKETPIVWSYSSTNAYKGFDCIQYDTQERVRSIIVDFVIEWR